MQTYQFTCGPCVSVRLCTLRVFFCRKSFLGFPSSSFSWSFDYVNASLDEKLLTLIIYHSSFISHLHRRRHGNLGKIGRSKLLMKCPPTSYDRQGVEGFEIKVNNDYRVCWLERSPIRRASNTVIRKPRACDSSLRFLHSSIFLTFRSIRKLHLLCLHTWATND